MATNSTSAGDVQLTCRLISAEPQHRKETIIHSLKQQVVNRQELPTGFAYEFRGSDAAVDELAESVKTERQCCSVFTCELRFGSEGAPVWLRLTGPAGANDFIVHELGM